MNAVTLTTENGDPLLTENGEEIITEGLTYKLDEQGDINEIKLQGAALRAYQKGELKLEQIESIISKTKASKQAVPEVTYLPDPYDRKEAETADKANNKVTHGAALAIVAGGKNAEKKVKSWRENTVNKHPLFPCNQGRDKMTVYLDPEGYNAAELWAKVHNLDALTLDVYMACLAFICDPRNKATYPHVGWFTVNPQQIADMKAFRRYGNDRRVLIGKIIEAIHTIADFRTDFVIHWPGQGKKEQNRMAMESGCRLIHICGVTYLDQGELFEYPEQFPKEDKNIVGVSLFIGKWGNYWLQDGETYYWVAAATRLLLELGSSKGDEFAKKIGGLLLTVEGGTRSRNKTLDFTVAELLEHIGELLAEEYRGKLVNGKQDGEHWASRTAEYLQAGLTTLLQIGVLASYNFSSDYPEPGDRGRGWATRWLKAKVYLTTPEAVPHCADNWEVAGYSSVMPYQMGHVAHTLRTLEGKRKVWGQWRALCHDLIYETLGQGTRPPA